MRGMRALHQWAASLVRTPARPSVAPAEAPSPDPFAGLLPWELRSKRALTVPRRRDGPKLEANRVLDLDLDHGKALLDFAGVCTIPLAIDRRTAEECGAAACDLTQEVRDLVRSRGVDPDRPSGFQYMGVHQRDPGRIDIRNHAALGKAPFDCSQLSEGAVWMPLVRHVLGGHATLLWKGVVVTEPGAKDQKFHPDTPPLSRAQWLRHSGGAGLPGEARPLPPHCLTVFVPLVDLSAANGPTAFLPGTHNPAVENLLHLDGADAGCASGVAVPVYLQADAGDAIIFDVRTLHAGSANVSKARRPVLYLVFGRSWFTTDVHRLLCEEAGLAIPGQSPEFLVPLMNGPSAIS